MYMSSCYTAFQRNMKTERVSQAAIDRIWASEWKQAHATDSRDFFSQRLFIEGYSVFKKYIPENVRRILDVGSGTGRYGLQLAKDFPNAHVVISDIVPESLELAEHIAREMGIRNVSFEKQDVNALSYPDESFDVVFCDAVIQHLPNVRNAMKEMRRVLKKDGVLIVSAVNTCGIHTLFKHFINLFGGGYRYGYEKSYTSKELNNLFFMYHIETIALDGFYPAYGMYRLKKHFSIAGFVGKLLNRLTKILDAVSDRFFSKAFGFEVFAVGRKWGINVQHSGALTLPIFEDTRGSILISSEFEKHIPFSVKRMYYITGFSKSKEARGNHAHKNINQAIFCLQGQFRLGLDDGTTYQKIWMRNPSYGVLLGPKLWHNMSRFSKDCVIMVLASDEYNEADYLRSYEEFKKYIEQNQ